MLILYAIFLKKSTKIGFTRKKCDLYFNKSRAPHGGIICAWLNAYALHIVYAKKTVKVNKNALIREKNF